MSSFAFKSKAETLRSLTDKIRTAIIPNLEIFTTEEWRLDPAGVAARIREKFSDLVIVRSSVAGEDSQESSHAGEFTSVPGVSPQAEGALEQAIDKVLASYKTEDAENQFFVQTLVKDVSVSGVMFSRDLDSGAPYFVINYDDHTGSTDSVTSGMGRDLRTYVRYRNSPQEASTPTLAKLVKTCEELEVLTGCASLDIEFAVDSAHQVHLLQVRPIASGKEHPTVAKETFDSYLLKIHRKVQKFNAPHPGLFGDKAIYSVMTDWNPAEIIGVRPRMLSLSLYKELVTDCIWAYQRHNYGYRDLRSFPLVVSFMGLPYVDVRASLNSFVPATLSEDLSHKLVDYYIDRLLQSPTDHDKVEFNVVFSCYYLNLPHRLSELKSSGFSDLELDRIKFALLKLTNNIAGADSKKLQSDLERISQLEGRLAVICSSDLPPLDKIYWLIEDCKRYGTLPFAGLARAGFIAVQFLRSFVESGIISTTEFQNFMGSLNTVARGLSKDTDALHRGAISKEQFLLKYGHLRPGTYDLLSARYDESFENYFRVARAGAQEATSIPEQPFRFSLEQMKELDRALEANGILSNAEGLLDFISKAIEGREYSKFIFTRNISEVLRMVGVLGERYSISKDDLAHLNIRTMLDLYSGVSHLDLPQILSEDIQRNRELYTITNLVHLPQLITNENDVYDFHLSAVEPNYVTLGKVTAVLVTEDEFPQSELSGKIAFIKSADPGYDWVFSRGIAGLVTMYGGSNSHMAIRCAELKIPAVIGCGETLFDQWKQSRILEINCANKQVLRVD